MSPDKWLQIKGQLQDTFKDVEIFVEPLEEGAGEREVALFDGPLGRMRLEYYTRPVVIDKVTHGSHRIGSHTEVAYVYSDSEKSHELRAYKWDDSQDDWLAIDIKNSFNI